MTQEDARAIIEDVLAAYKVHHKTLPTRVVVLKTSRFKDEEAEGIIEALDAHDTEMRDLVRIQESYSVKVLRDGS